MYFYAFVDSNNIVTGVYELPSEITAPGYIRIDSKDETLIGKRYNPVTGEFEDPMWYYAKIVGDGFVIEIVSSSTQQDAPNLIPISSDDQTLIGKWWNGTEFVTIVPHTHENKVVIDGITAEKITAWDNGAGSAGVPGPAGPAGADGKSAFEVAAANGYVGTVAEWLASLKGEQGNPGPVGPTGAQGPQGIQGVQGLKGDTGDRGPTGATGATGPKGATGSQGPKGATGPQGPAGDPSNCFAFGTYTGNGSVSQQITLPFECRAAYVSPENGVINANGCVYGGLSTGLPIIMGSTAVVAVSGNSLVVFTVGNGHANDNGVTYRYMAIK